LILGFILYVTGIVIPLVCTAATVILTVAMYRMNLRAVADRDDRADLNRRLDAAENNSHEVTAKLIDARLRQQTHDASNSIQAFVIQTEALKEEMRSHVVELKQLAERDHTQEKTTIVAMGELKQWMLREFAGKAEYMAMDGHVRRLEQQVTALSQQFDGLAKRVERGP
jgi:hypothetical protein